MKSAATRSALPTSLLGNTYRADTSHEIRCTHIGHDALSERRKLIKRVRSLEIGPPRERDQIAQVNGFHRHCTRCLAREMTLACGIGAVTDDKHARIFSWCANACRSQPFCMIVRAVQLHPDHPGGSPTQVDGFAA